jgi:hypothetical protein
MHALTVLIERPGSPVPWLQERESVATIALCGVRVLGWGCTVGRLLRLRRVLDVAPALALTAEVSPSAGDVHSLTLRMDVQDVQVGQETLQTGLETLRTGLCSAARQLFWH